MQNALQMQIALQIRYQNDIQMEMSQTACARRGAGLDPSSLRKSRRAASERGMCPAVFVECIRSQVGHEDS